MEWIKLTAENEPDGEVLAANFEPGTYGYKEKIIGYISIDGDTATATSENEELDNVTHFIDLKPFDL